jgi:hypothetical protein
MEELLKEREITSFNAKDNRIMCFPHVINIAVGHVLNKMSKVMAPEAHDNFSDLIGEVDTDEGRGFGQTFESACAGDPISRLRRIVAGIRSSGQRRYIQPRQLLRDVRTRWDSTYNMLQRCIEMRLVSFI